MAATTLLSRPPTHYARRSSEELVTMRLALSAEKMAIVRACADDLHVSLAAYLATVLARFHGLPDPETVGVGKIDLTTLLFQPPLMDDPHKLEDAYIRVPVSRAETYREFAERAGCSTRRYLGEVVTQIHQSAATNAAIQEEREPILLFGLGLEEVSDGVYRARARTA